jgi:hypothetical protein
MLKTVWKVMLPKNDTFDLELPLGAEILAFAAQYEEPCIWMLVDPEEKKTEKRSFRLAGTGHKIKVPEAKPPIGISGRSTVETPTMAHIGTCQLAGGSLIFHLFEIFDK